MRGFSVRSKGSRLRQKPYPGMVVASKGTLYFVVDVQSLPSAAEGVLAQFETWTRTMTSKPLTPPWPTFTACPATTSA
jgi:hypothetical protein